MTYTSILWSIVFALSCCYALLRRRRSCRGIPLPPGPRPLPFVGNVFDMPTKGGVHVFREMNAKYGDVVHLDVLGQPIIVLGSHEAAVDLLEKRSANYSDRPTFVLGEICQLTWVLTLIRYGPWLRRHRRAVHEFFNMNAVKNYRPAQRADMNRFLHRLMDTPRNFQHHIRMLFGSTILRIAYGIEVDNPGNERYLTLVEEGISVFNAVLVPGAFMVETFPFLRYFPAWFPGARYKHNVAQWKRDVLNVLHVPWEVIKGMMSEGTAPPSMARELMERASRLSSEQVEEELKVARASSAVAYAAGSDTTLSTVQWFFFAMAAHPEVQRKAQAELDAIVGPGRLPEFEDCESLPYVNAVIKECLRWRSVVPLNVPHKSLEDDEYRGFFIPKGSLVVANIWAYSRDPTAFPDGEAFKPERFLKNGTLNPDVRAPEDIAFGYGRRICPGKHFAEQSLFLIVSNVLHTLNISAPLGEDGKTVRMESRMTEGVISYPESFTCDIEPRSSSAESLIRSSCPSL